jgi:ferredoxin
VVIGVRRVLVDQDTCCGSGLCADALPSVFDQRVEDGVVRLLDENPDPALDGELRAVAFRCPSRAITVVE